MQWWYGKGFTLIEIIVAMLLVTILAAGMFGVFTAADRYITMAKHRMIAMNFARETAEELKKYVEATTWPDMGGSSELAGSGPGVPRLHDTESFLSLPANRLPPGASREYTVTDIDVDGGGVDYKKVTIRVYWPETQL